MLARTSVSHLVPSARVPADAAAAVTAACMPRETNGEQLLSYVLLEKWFG